MKLMSIIIGLVWLTTSATALILNVPDEYSTIQSAITASSSGDTVLVQPGTYQQNVTFQGRAITVASTYVFTGDETAIEQTIINGGNSNSCVRFNNDETASSQLIGFTLTNGSTDYYGGGIYCYGASPTLRNLIVTGNNAAGGGGMAFFAHSAATGSDILVADNSGDEGGGGIYCHDSGDIVMSNLVLRNNSASHGGGLLISYV
jgi:predicted outer membrane repeat protein